MKRIPIKAAADIAHKYGYDQVVIVARKVGEGGGEHVTTYGRDKANCDVAARTGEFLKQKIMKWVVDQKWYGDYIDILFDGPPDMPAPRFVEVEDHWGHSISFGEWVDRGDGYWALRFYREVK